MQDTTLAHFSDPHLPFEPRLKLHERLSKRQLSAWSWRSRRHIQLPEILECLRGDLQRAAPNHIVVTGDITNFSLPGEFRAAAQWLRTLGDARRLSVIPGNHDALVAVPAEAAWGLWSEWMSDDDVAAPSASAGWPYVHRRGVMALVGLNSARPTAPLLASGALGEAQLQRLESILLQLATEGVFRVVALHHPVADGAISARKALRDRASLRAVLRRAGAELVLHGHAREARVDQVAGPAGAILCLGLPSSSAAPNRRDQGARWQLLRIRPQGSGWRLGVDVRLWQPRSAAFVSGGCFEFAIAHNIARV